MPSDDAPPTPEEQRERNNLARMHPAARAKKLGILKPFTIALPLPPEPEPSTPEGDVES
jgi:hypothetical protein